MSEQTYISSCHSAPVYVAEGAGVRVEKMRAGQTYYYVCTECGKPCDPKPEATSQPDWAEVEPFKSK